MKRLTKGCPSSLILPTTTTASILNGDKMCVKCYKNKKLKRNSVAFVCRTYGNRQMYHIIYTVGIIEIETHTQSIWTMNPTAPATAAIYSRGNSSSRSQGPYFMVLQNDLCTLHLTKYTYTNARAHPHFRSRTCACKVKTKQTDNCILYTCALYTYIYVYA